MLCEVRKDGTGEDWRVTERRALEKMSVLMVEIRVRTGSNCRSLQWRWARIEQLGRQREAGYTQWAGLASALSTLSQ